MTLTHIEGLLFCHAPYNYNTSSNFGSLQEEKKYQVLFFKSICVCVHIYIHNFTKIVRWASMNKLIYIIYNTINIKFKLATSNYL